ncbi:MAG: glycosyltransferase [Bacteroidota bacterium]|nr:glycosyltransferase [Bacteroidota bacterium]
MNIVLLANYAPTSLSGYVYRALQQMGHAITFVSPQEGLEDSIGCKPFLDVPLFLNKQNLKPDLLIVVESSVHPLLVPLNLEKLNCVTAWWAIDNHINYRWHKEFAVFFDYVFFAQKDFTQQASKYAGKNVAWLPLACDPSIHQNKHLERTVACGFVGNMNKHRQHYFDQLKTKTHIQIVNGLNPYQMADYYNTCKSVFNISMRGDLNMRTFEAMACGSLLITQDIQNGINDLFEPGKNIITHNLNNAAEVINYYEKNSELIAPIAQAGYELVIREHTYSNRMQTLITLAGGGKKQLFETDVYAIRKHYMFNHRHFKSNHLDSYNTLYNHVSFFKKIKYKVLYFFAFLWHKKYLWGVRKFG